MRGCPRLRTTIGGGDRELEHLGRADRSPPGEGSRHQPETDPEAAATAILTAGKLKTTTRRRKLGARESRQVRSLTSRPDDIAPGDVVLGAQLRRPQDRMADQAITTKESPGSNPQLRPSGERTPMSRSIVASRGDRISFRLRREAGKTHQRRSLRDGGGNRRCVQEDEDARSPRMVRIARNRAYGRRRQDHRGSAANSCTAQ